MNVQMQEFQQAIEHDGYYLMENALEPSFVSRAKIELERAILKESEYHHGKIHTDHGMVLLCCLYGGVFFEIFEIAKVMDPFRWLMGDGCIVYSQTSTSMPPHGANFSSRIHVDCPRIIEGYISSFMALMLLDDFTEENGATWFLPGSHNLNDQPSPELFYSKARRLIAPAGSVLFWHPRIWHAGGRNLTDSWRHAMTVVMCRPYMKQRIDIPRALSGQDLSGLSDVVKQKLGFFAQVPSSYDEYYAPFEVRKFRQKAE